MTGWEYEDQLPDDLSDADYDARPDADRTDDIVGGGMVSDHGAVNDLPESEMRCLPEREYNDLVEERDELDDECRYLTAERDALAARVAELEAELEVAEEDCTTEVQRHVGAIAAESKDCAARYAILQGHYDNAVAALAERENVVERSIADDEALMASRERLRQLAVIARGYVDAETIGEEDDLRDAIIDWIGRLELSDFAPSTEER